MKRNVQRILALGLAAALTAGPACVPASAAGELAAAYDESYYATLDYYGGLLDSSVVKSYRTNGQTVLTDYGVYDEVVNLTDDRVPTVKDGAVTFDLGADAPERFYFEAKTEQPFYDLPWTISLSYQLNGAPVLAEDLAGKTGLVEIDLDVLPNPNASEYSRNNLVLTAATAFNADEILSLEAPGAEVQLIGNLRTVIFMVMPGEEQHFSIRVGSEDFSFAGLMLLAVPATLSQLDQIADLRDAKEEVEDSYDAINDSLDVILNTLDGMSGSLNATANGLDQLNDARGTISAGKGQVYDSLDAALDAAGPLVEAMEPMAGHLATAQQALTETVTILNEMNDTAASLKPELEAVRATIKSIQSDTNKLRALLEDVENYNDRAASITEALGEHVEDLGEELNSLRFRLNTLTSALKSAKGISKVDQVSVGGMTTSEEVLAALEQARGAQAMYSAALAAGQLPEGTSFADYLALAGKTEAEIQGIEALLAAAEDEESFQEQLELMDTANTVIPEVNGTIGEVNQMVAGLTGPTAKVTESLSEVCRLLGEDELCNTLGNLVDLAGDLLADLDAHDGEAAELTVHLDELGDIASRVTEKGDAALDQIQSLTDLMNTYEPQTQQALSDAQTFTQAASDSISSLVDAASAAEKLAKDSGNSLDSGTQQTLSGLAEALRRSTIGLDQTGVIRNAKDTIDTLIDDQWNSHTGEENNLLLMDAGATPISMTSERNGTPTSIQFIMRTQEITESEDDAEETAAQAAQEESTFFGRIAAMFQDFWKAITGIFRK